MTMHKLIIGDARQMPEIRSNSVHLIVTSPPYWGAPMWADLWNSYGITEWTQKNFKKSHKIWYPVWKECYRVLIPGARLVVNIMDIPSSTDGMWLNSNEVIRKCLKIGFVVREKIIWLKYKQYRSPPGSAPYPFGVLIDNLWEYILVFQKSGRRDYSKMSKSVKEKSKLKHKEMRDWTGYNYWKFASASAKRESHTAPFPEELPKRVITLYTYIGDTVLDPFVGSGTTMKVAMELHRSSIGIEIDKKYLKVIKDKVRWGQQGLNSSNSYKLIIREEKESILNWLKS